MSDRDLDYAWLRLVRPVAPPRRPALVHAQRVSLALFAACASDPTPGEPAASEDDVTHTQQESLIEAGAASRAVGIVKWRAERFGNRARFRGFSESDALISEFQLANDTRLVESRCPDVGLRNLDDPSLGTLSAASATFVDALASDLEATYNAAALEAAASVHEKVLQDCFVFSQCYDLGWYGWIKGWWEPWDCHLYIPPCASGLHALLTNR